MVRPLKAHVYKKDHGLEVHTAVPVVCGRYRRSVTRAVGTVHPVVAGWWRWTLTAPVDGPIDTISGKVATKRGALAMLKTQAKLHKWYTIQ